MTILAMLLLSLAQGHVAVNLKVDRTRMALTDHLELTLEAEADEKFEVVLPQLPFTFGDFQVVTQRRVSHRLMDNARIRWAKSYDLAPSRSGELSIPPLQIGFHPVGTPQDADRVQTEGIRIEASSVLPASETESEIREILSLPAQPQDSGGRMVPAIVSAVLAAGALFLWRRRASTLGPAGSLPSPEDRALAELDKLSVDGEAGAILRRYYEERLGFSAPGATSDEFVAAVAAAAQLPPRHLEALSGVLADCDLAKFTDGWAAARSLHALVNVCRGLVGEAELATTRSRAAAGGFSIIHQPGGGAT